VKSYLLALVCVAALCAQAFADSIRITDLAAKPQIAKTLTGRGAAKFLKAFNSLPWDQTPGKRCHFPAFRIERLTGDSVTLDATICFACDNVRFSTPAEKGLQGFDASAGAAKQFHATLTGLFPTQ
jgi:hypothetical protein